MDQHTFQCCCAQPDCPQLVYFNESFKRVEHDAILAAEIGQALLKERVDLDINEESEDEKDEDDSLIAYNTMKDNLLELKQLRWEKENSDGMIHVLQAEIRALKETTNNMKKQIDNYEKEIEKKKLCDKLLIIKTDIEEELKTQVSDLKQEICQLRKSENNVQLKYKRLEVKHETLQLTHEELSREHDTLLDSISKKMILEQPKFLNQRNVNKNGCPMEMKPEPIANNIHNKQTAKMIPQFRVSHTNCNKDPFDVLQSVTQQTLEKINATDTRVLNRRLRRVFDMSELSDMSNSILNTILLDLSEFKSQFDWVHDYGAQQARHFFPLVNTIQQLLQEISTNKITLNDLQADYVKRIERLTNSQCSSLTHGKSLAITTTKITATTAIATTATTKLGETQTSLSSFAPSNNDGQKSLLQELLSLFTIH